MKQGTNYFLHHIEVGPLETNCYLLVQAASRATLIVDPGAEPEKIASLIRKYALKPAAILNTHGHADHIGADEVIRQQYHIPVYIHAADAPFLGDPALNSSILLGGQLILPPADVLFEDGQRLSIGGMTLTIIHTPGHTPGSVCVLYEDLLFTGDTLFCRSVGRCDLAGGNEEKLEKSLKKFHDLPGHLAILPGHGPECILEEELQHNPYVSHAH